MKISLKALQAYISIPVDHNSLIEILEDIGLEVKRYDVTDTDVIFTLELLANRVTTIAMSALLVSSMAGRIGH